MRLFSACKIEGDAAVGDDELQLQPAPAAPRTSTTPVLGRTENHGQLLTYMNEGKDSYNKWQQQHRRAVSARKERAATVTSKKTMTRNTTPASGC